MFWIALLSSAVGFGSKVSSLIERPLRLASFFPSEDAVVDNTLIHVGESKKNEHGTIFQNSFSMFGSLIK